MGKLWQLRKFVSKNLIVIQFLSCLFLKFLFATEICLKGLSHFLACSFSFY